MYNKIVRWSQIVDIQENARGGGRTLTSMGYQILNFNEAPHR